MVPSVSPGWLGLRSEAIRPAQVYTHPLDPLSRGPWKPRHSTLCGNPLKPCAVCGPSFSKLQGLGVGRFLCGWKEARHWAWASFLPGLLSRDVYRVRLHASSVLWFWADQKLLLELEGRVLPSSYHTKPNLPQCSRSIHQNSAPETEGQASTPRYTESICLRSY